MRTIGLDLAVTGEHKAIVLDDATTEYITPILRLRTSAGELSRLLERAREGVPDAPVRVVMEPTAMAWFPVSAFLRRQQVDVYLVNSQQVAALRRYYRHHAKSDRIDARILARLPLFNPEHLHPLVMPSPKLFACQRGCKRADRLTRQITAAQNRIRDLDRFLWPGLEGMVFSEPFAPAARWFRGQFYDPRRAVAAGADTIQKNWLASALVGQDDGRWAEPLVTLAGQVLALYGAEDESVDFDLLQEDVRREQAMMADCEVALRELRNHTVRPLYRQLHPSRNLETIPGVGQDGAAVYVSLMVDPRRFDSQRRFRSWTGMIPKSSQTATSEAKGLHITQAGPNLVRKFAYMGADAARKRDPQIAQVYYTQMVQYGKHHSQALCTCATHLLDRIRVVLMEDRPYELRDVSGERITSEEAMHIIATRYTVSESVRKRNNKRARKERQERRAERQQMGKAIHVRKGQA